MNTEFYIGLLKSAIQVRHQCAATHVESVPISAKMGDETVWTGAVEVFGLEGNESSKLCYAWCEKANSREQRFVTILQRGLVITPINAVHAWLATRPVVVHPVASEPAMPREILEAVLPAEDENRHTKSVSTIDLARNILGLGEPAHTCSPRRYSS